MADRPRFNPFVRSRHTGTSPYRSNFNMQTYSDFAQNRFAPRYLELPSNSNSTESMSSQTSASRSGRPRFGAITNQIQNGLVGGRKMGAIPKQPIPKMTKRNKENRPEDLNLVAGDRNKLKTVRGRQNIIIYDKLPEPPNGPSFHRDRLQAETCRLMDLAQEWATIRASMVDLPDWIGGEIDAAVCGIRLMVSSKFEQFRELIEECATRFRVPSCIPVPGTKKNRPNQPAKPAVLPEDLDGFWEMMNVQVEAMNKKVIDLQALRENNWEPVDVVQPIRIKPAPSNAKNVKKPVGKSNFREFLRQQKEGRSESKRDATSVQSVGRDDLIGQGAVAIVVVTPPHPPRDRQVTFVTPEASEFATPPHTEATPMPTTPMWEPEADADLTGRSIELGFNDDIVSSTPAVVNDSGCETLNGTKFAPFDFSGVDDLPIPRTPSRSRLSISRRDTLMTPRAAQNLMKARNSRRSSIGIIMQTSIMGRVMSAWEGEEEFVPSCQSPISEASTCPSSPSSEASPHP